VSTRTLTTSPVRSPFAGAGSRIGYPVWFPLTVYAIARLVDLLLIVLAARHQIALPRGAAGLAGYNIWEPTPASPWYGAVASNWDGQWYSSIAADGYPATIPRDPAGHALQNQWGFYPVYPLLVGGIMRISGLAFTVVAPILSCLLGAAAVTVMFRLVDQRSGRFAASATVVLVCTYMAAPVMQIAYTESLALLLVCTALLLLRNRRYGWLIPVLVTLALTRAVALAFVPVLVAHAISGYRRRHVEPFPLADRWRVAGLTGLAVAVTGLWPAIAALTTGDPAAYTQTMSSWGSTGKLRVLVAFPAGIEAMLAKADADVVRTVLETAGMNAGRISEALAERGLVRPSTTQGHIADVTETDVVFDAPTTQGGSGGPLLNRNGVVIGVSYAVLSGFGGNSFAVPIRHALPLLARARPALR